MAKYGELCPSCENGSLKKQGDGYVCQSCGARHSIDDASEIEIKIIELQEESKKLHEDRMFTEELRLLNKALELDEEDVNTWVKIGRCYSALQRFEKAMEAYNKALELDPSEGSAYCNIGGIMILRSNWHEAEKYYKKALPLMDKATGDYWVCYANYAIVIAQLGDKKKAAAMIKDAEKNGYENGNGCRKLAGVKKQGCYVATCVYNSYDCPELWTLRRFRDEYLEERVLGRAFIKVYYKLSPCLVKAFGKKPWFNTLCKSRLDRLVVKLQNKGYKSTQYYDK